MSLPKLLRQARTSISRGDYSQAECLYEKILAFPEMADDLDTRLRYAFCAEKNGNLTRAIASYSAVIDIYRQHGEEGAAASLERIIGDLEKGPEKRAPEPPIAEESEKYPPPLDDAALMQQLCNMGQLITLTAGEMLCHKGDMPNMLWLLRSGTLTVHLPGYDEPDTIHVKEDYLTLVGEVGFFTRQRRHADVEAATMAELFAIKAEDIYLQQERDPAFNAAMERLLIERWAEPVLTRHTVFEHVNDIDRMRIMHTFKPVSLGAGETLIEAGREHNYTYMLQSGCMFFMRPKEKPDDTTETDNGSLMSTIFPGDMVHLGGLLKGYKSEYRVVTATPVQLLRLAQEEFEPFTPRRPWIIQAILRFSRRPANLQVMKPNDDYLWRADRHVKLSGSAD